MGVYYGGYQIVARFCFLKNAFDFAFWLLILIFSKKRKIAQNNRRKKSREIVGFTADVMGFVITLPNLWA